MSSQLAISAMYWVEFALWTALCLLFFKRGWQRRFPAMGAYLILHVAATPVLLAILDMMQWHLWNPSVYVYSLSYFAVYIASAVLLFFTCMEIFRSALASFPGLSQAGIVVFRWAALVSVVVSLTSISGNRWAIGGANAHNGIALAAAVSYALMHSVSVLELCLLAFLCLSMNALLLPIRDAAFGIALGFGVMSSAHFIGSALVTRHTPLTGPLQFVYETVILAALTIWAIYAVLPEPARKPAVVPAGSRIYRWNEIASALGHTGTQVAVQQPANSFFLTDVEKVVEKVLNRNLKERESER